MAGSFSFAGPAGGVSGFGGGQSIWSNDWGRPWAAGMQAGYDVNQMFRQLNAQRQLDPSILAAQKAQADEMRLGSDWRSSINEGLLGDLAKKLELIQKQQQEQTALQTDPGAAATAAANAQAMQDQSMDAFAKPFALNAVFGDKAMGTSLNQMLRLPPYAKESPAWGGGGYGF